MTYINNDKDFTVGKNITFIDKDDNIIKMGSIIAKTKNGDILILENDVIDKLKYSKSKK